MSSLANSAEEAFRLLERSRRNGIKLWVEGEELRYTALAGVMTPERITELRAHKLDVIKLLKAASTMTETEVRLLPRSTTGRHPLMFLQHSWVTRYSVSSARNIHLLSGMRCKGNLNYEMMEQSLRQVLRRHAILRSRIDGQGDEYWLTVADDIEVPITDLDLRGEETKSAIDSFAFELFDLRSGPMLRFGVRNMGGENRLLVLVIHHAIADGWSLFTIWAEIFSFYNALAMGRQGSASALPILLQFTDYMHFKRAWLQSSAAQHARNFWRSVLSGCEAPFQLPYDRTKPVDWSRQPDPISGQLSLAESRALGFVSKSTGVSFANVVLAAFAALLAWWGHRTDMVIWVCHSGRRRREVMNVVGCFLDTWLLRATIYPTSPFRRTLDSVNSAALAAVSMLDLPGVEMAGQFASARGDDLRRIVMINFMPEVPISSGKPHSITAEEAQRGIITATPEELVQPKGYMDAESRLGIMLTVRGGQNSLRWSFQHDPEAFEDSTIARLSETFGKLLAHAGSDPNDCLTNWSFWNAECSQAQPARDPLQ